jgi:hypothetical protein
MDRSWIIGVTVTIVILIAGGLFWAGFGGEKLCVPASCCHSTECILEDGAPDCGGRLCTMSCESGTLDCGQARCEYIDGNCEVVSNE